MGKDQFPVCFKILFICFFYLCECVVNRCPQRPEKESDSLELESQAGPNCPTLALRFALCSYGKAMMNS